jgi:hypothetical protein
MKIEMYSSKQDIMLHVGTYWYGFIKMGTTNYRTILEVFGENIFSKFMLPITLPGDASFVHRQFCFVDGEAVCVIE